MEPNREPTIYTASLVTELTYEFHLSYGLNKSQQSLKARGLLERIFVRSGMVSKGDNQLLKESIFLYNIPKTIFDILLISVAVIFWTFHWKEKKYISDILFSHLNLSSQRHKNRQNMSKKKVLILLNIEFVLPTNPITLSYVWEKKIKLNLFVTCHIYFKKIHEKKRKKNNLATYRAMQF